MILIISQSNRTAKDISEIFHYMSILSYGTTPKEGLSEISTIYKAIIIIEPSSFPDIFDYLRRIRSYSSAIPIYAVSKGEYKTPFEIFDRIYSKKDFSTTLALEMIKDLNNACNAKIGVYKLAGIDASFNSFGVSYFQDKLNLTKTETMILRYLIRCYPLPQKSTQILKYSFKHSRAPEEHSIKTHISIINKKFKILTERKMIELIHGEGYRIITPEPK